MSRRIFVGDIQGCRVELDHLLEELAFRPGDDELHPAGDFVNRGPDSLGVLRRLVELDAGGVLGNHDVHALRVARGTRALGKRDTLDELLRADDRAELLRWLEERPFVRTWDDVVLVHAGLSPAWSDPIGELRGLDPYADDERIAFCTRVRYCTERGEVPARDDPPPDPPYVPWFDHVERLGLTQSTIVFGHWARMGLVHRPGLRGLDTGCVWGNELTAWIAEEDRFVSVPAARAYSPMSTPKGGMPPRR